MRGSGFYTAYWLLTRPPVWVFGLAFGAIRSLIALLFRLFVMKRGEPGTTRSSA